MKPETFCHSKIGEDRNKKRDWRTILIVLSGWIILLLYAIYDYDRYDRMILYHFLKPDTLYETFFHIIILSLPLLSAAVGFLEYRNNRLMRELKTALSIIELERAKLNAIIECMGEGISIQDPEYKVLFQNRIHKELVGDHAGEYCYMAYQQKDHICEGCHIARTFEDGRLRTVEKSRITDEGMKYYEITSSPLRDSEGRIIAGIESVRDVTDRKLAADAIRESEEFYRKFIDSASDMVFIKDDHLRFVAVNKHLADSFGKTQADFVGKTDFDFLPLEIAEQRRQSDLMALQSDNIVIMEENIGDRCYETRKFRIKLRNDRFGVGAFIRDFTENKKMQSELERHALYDSLTGLPNRFLFMDRLRNIFDHKRRQKDLIFTVLFIDIDYFKRINDSYGHIAGDGLLAAVAQRLKACVRPGDTVSRFGGDEFVIILDSLNHEDDAMTMANRIHRAMELPFEIRGNEIYITASIGITISRSDYATADDFLRDADTAMYQAKARGRACNALFDRTMHISAVESMTIQNDLRKSVEKGEFLLHYQPIMSLEMNHVAGFEALLRWDHPDLGVLLPDRFISIAEETGMIVPLGKWVLEEACGQIMKWKEQYPADPPLFMCVNLSAKQFMQGLPGQLNTVLSEFCLEPESLRIEITESVIIDNSALAAEILAALRRMRIQVYLDDFGTGYSSLSYLHKFPVSGLKVDRSFVKNIRFDREAREIMRAIASLASSLNMIMIVEGVEDEDQLEVFSQFNCKYAQGYLFSQALEVKRVEDYMLQFSV